ncbi:MAG: hypothetical protein WC379_00445 [Methanoregula sp.]|jgi:hypothetical protein
MVTILLVAGCTGQIDDRAGTGIGASKTTTTPFAPPVASKLTSVDSSLVYPSSNWISIVPIVDHQSGDVFTITSTTNLPAGDEIRIHVFLIQIGEGSGASGIVKVVKGSGNINTTTFTLNTSGFDPDEYAVSEYSIPHDTFADASFNLTPDPFLQGNVTLKPGNFIDWEKLNLPPLKVNASIKPEVLHDWLRINHPPIQNGQIRYGSIIIFAPDNIVYCFDKNGTQYATYFGFRELRSVSPPSPDAVVKGPIGNVTTIIEGNERILTEIYEVPINY